MEPENSGSSLSIKQNEEFSGEEDNQAPSVSAIFKPELDIDFLKGFNTDILNENKDISTKFLEECPTK